MLQFNNNVLVMESPCILVQSTRQTSGAHCCIDSRSLTVAWHALDSLPLPTIIWALEFFLKGRLRRCTAKVGVIMASCIPGHSMVPSTLRRPGVHRAVEPDCRTARSTRHLRGRRDVCLTPRELGEYDDCPPTSKALCLHVSLNPRQ